MTMVFARSHSRRAAPRFVSIGSFASLASLALLASCGGQTSAASADGGGVPDNGGHTMGAPCTPKLEDEPTFTGFLELEVSIESSPADPSGSAVCLVNHFRGRTTCPYGQDESGAGPNGAPACKTPSGQPVVGNVHSLRAASIDPQCLDRRAKKVVHWSCRCANALERTDDGDTYCTCPSSMACAPLVTSIGTPYDHLSGSYCIVAGAAFDRNNACSASCDFASGNCP